MHIKLEYLYVIEIIKITLKGTRYLLPSATLSIMVYSTTLKRRRDRTLLYRTLFWSLIWLLNCYSWRTRKLAPLCNGRIRLINLLGTLLHSKILNISIQLICPTVIGNVLTWPRMICGLLRRSRKLKFFWNIFYVVGNPLPTHCAFFHLFV